MSIGGSISEHGRSTRSVTILDGRDGQEEAHHESQCDSDEHPTMEGGYVHFAANDFAANGRRVIFGVHL